jgi:hypothetical protein
VENNYPPKRRFLTHFPIHNDEQLILKPLQRVLKSLSHITSGPEFAL